MSTDTRNRNAKLNIYISLFCQLITIVCGLIVPRRMLVAFGSEANGAVTSITTFLGYIALLEGGIGGVARAALYKPLADKDDAGISAIMTEIKRFFRRVGYFFVIYVLVIACTFRNIAHTDVFDWATSFWLVIILSASTFAQYFIGISNVVLLIAAQKQYLISLISVGATVANAVVVVVMTYLGCDLISVKIVSGLVFIAKPVLLWLIVRRQFHITTVKGDHTLLKDKWTGLGQHIAYFLHSHTDVVVLTLFGNLRAVSVYGVYALVTNAVQNIATSFSSGMEAVFGDMYAKGEKQTLQDTFGMYDTLMSIISTILFGTTMALIIPFVTLYTKGVTDADYIQPLFGVMLAAAGLIYCLRSPYHNMIIASGQFRQTNAASYGESIINIALSVILVVRFGLVGVAIGTVVATLYRSAFYAIYLSKNVLNRSLMLWLRREALNAVIVVATVLLGRALVANREITSYVQWALYGCVVGIGAVLLTLGGNWLLYRRDLKAIWTHLIRR